MARKTISSLLFVWLVALCGVLHAEPSKTITLKIFDGKTGHPLMPTGYEIRVDRLQAVHNDWVKQNEDGSAEITVPADAHEISVHTAYDNSMEIYINCDAQKNEFGDVWYVVPKIMSEGMVMANGCGKAKVNEKYKTTAAPGELIMFVREKNWKEKAKD
jgi:hypothetical protein